MKGEFLTSGRGDDPVVFRPPPMPTWQVGAVCGQIDPDLFYEDDDTSAEEAAFRPSGSFTSQAKRVCHHLCEPFRRAECLAWAMNENEVYGVWGGTSPPDRKKLRDELREKHGIPSWAPVPAGLWGPARVDEAEAEAEALAASRKGIYGTARRQEPGRHDLLASGERGPRGGARSKDAPPLTDAA